VISPAAGRSVGTLLLSVLLASTPVTANGQPAETADPVLLLLTAARTGDLTGIAGALANGARVDATDPTYSQTALMRAAMFGQAKAAEALIRAGAKTSSTSDGGRSVLHWAAIGGSADVIRLLVKAGAVVDAPDGYEETPLGTAVDENRVAAAEALVAAGARVDRMKRPLASHLGLVLGNGVTGPPLEVLRVLIRSKQGLEVPSQPDNLTALLVAAEWAHLDGSTQVARELLAAGARRDAKNKDGRTAVEEVRARQAGETNPAYKANRDRMLLVLEGRTP
jgi:hypothetical protein